jgi:two-component system NtrC family sensor kinase
MDALGTLASRLAECTDLPSAADLLAEYVRAETPGAAVRVYLLGPGDRCAGCPRARACMVRDRCLHLEGSQGDFAWPPGHAGRIPRLARPWSGVLAGVDHAGPAPEEMEPESEPGEASEPSRPCHLFPLRAGGEVEGVLAVRLPEALPDERHVRLQTAAHLSASTFRLLGTLDTANRRSKQILLVNEVGRKVNSILNDELLLRQAVVDIQRTFGFHNVMIFMREQGQDHLTLLAQASTHALPSRVAGAVAVGEGIVGRACRRGATEVVDDVSQDPDFVPWYSDTRSEIAVPIQIGGVVEGVLNVESDRVGGFGDADRLVLETVANQLAIAIENARLFGMVREREDRYRLLLESNPGAVLHLDGEGRVVFTNPAASRLTGFDRADLQERLAEFTDLAVPEDREALDAALREALRGVARHDLEFRVVHADGRPRSVKASLQPLTRERGEARGVVVLAVDQSREKELDDQLRQSEKLSAIGGLVSGVAHELNNPLAGILGFSQLLLGRPVEEWTRGDVEKIERNARRCQQIVENLLAFARQARLRKRRANVNEVIDSVIRLHEYQFRMDNVVIERDLDLRVPALPLDVNRWQQVFINLAANAHQALLSGGGEDRRIRFATRRRDGAVEIRVSDNGPGVPPAMRSRVFEPFFTTKESGTGLGLGICFGIVAEHGGTIELDPHHEPGASFRITVPIHGQGGEPGPEVDAASPAPAPAVSPERPRRALVVDDEEHVAEVVAGALQRHHYQVDAVRDAETALARLREGRYDVILTDVFMPGRMSGLDLYDLLRRERPDLARRMIFLTGNALNDAVADRIADQGVRCIEKPFDIHELASTVNEVANGPSPT